MESDQISLLLSINEAIAKIKDPQSLFLMIFEKLQAIFHFRIAGIIMFDKDKTHFDLALGASPFYEYNPDTMVYQKNVPVASAPFGFSINDPKIIRHDKSILFALRELKKNSAGLLEYLDIHNISEFLHIPLQTGGNLIGFMLIAFSDEVKIEDKNLDLLKKVSNLVAVAISNAIAYEELNIRSHEKEALLKVTNLLVNIRDKELLLTTMANELNMISSNCFVAFRIDSGNPLHNIDVTLIGDKNNQFKPYRQNLKKFPVNLLKEGKQLNQPYNVVQVDEDDFEELCVNHPYFNQLHADSGVIAMLYMQHKSSEGHEINVILGKDKASSIIEKEREIKLTLSLFSQSELLLRNFFAYEEINQLKKQLEQEKNYLLDEINLSNNFQEIIGTSQTIQNVLFKVKQVAPLDATVLIVGETGTGKELIARALHNLSGRKDKALIKVNCAALPAQLIESELFGHEKGSFTGAIDRKIGKFELANNGTIFLDEIGEMPLELQSKLLRVLQEREFERVGGKETISANIRVIAATNRNLENEVAVGRFRADLYFRLNVFPIVVPPLRERAEDIPLFVKYFMEKYSKTTGKEIKMIRKSDLDALVQYNWPGNIRELEHLIERAIIISEGSNLDLSDFIYAKGAKSSVDITLIKTLRELEKEHIIHALKAANGKITGENSASALLGINGKTLGSKMKKLGIKREFVITV